MREDVTLFLAGDVMTGRGVDQVLPHPCEPTLYESYISSAADYVTLAERANGPIRKPLDFAYVWGAALAELDRRRPDARMINLETAITTSSEPDAKGIHYRMHPRNVPVLSAAGIDCCTLANNHVLDWGPSGLLETLETLQDVGVASTGAGNNLKAACRPAILSVPGGRVVVIALGSGTSGIPGRWAASDDQSGVNYLPHLNAAVIQEIGAQIGEIKEPGDIVVVSLHWGANWGYDISSREHTFAHGLIDEAGADIVWGHSSHHPKAIEVHNGKPILFGCGDFLNDYEGISGYASYRSDLVLMYFPTLRLSDGTLQGLEMVPLQIRNFRLRPAPRADAQWLCDLLSREGTRYGTRVDLGPENELALIWDEKAA